MSLILVVAMLFGTAHAAPVVGDINSPYNDLSMMTSFSGPWDGTNPDLNGELTDTLPLDIKAREAFKEGKFPAGIYSGWLHKGDFVFYRVAEVSGDVEWREVIRVGRCGNPGWGRYPVCKPQPPVAPPPPCELPPAPICIPPPPCLPPVVNVYPEVVCPAPPPCPTPVVNNYLSCPIERPIQYQPQAGAQFYDKSYAGSSISFGWGSIGGRRAAPSRLCPPFPPTPIKPPPAW